MSEPAPKCENNAVFKQNYTAKLFITFRVLFQHRGKSRFARFPQKKVL